MKTTYGESQIDGPLTVDEIRTRPTLSVEEAAQVLGIGRTTAYAAVKSGQVPTIRLGRRVRVPVRALLRLLGDDDVQPTVLPVQTAGQIDAEALGRASNGR
ncbi:helix-turn-helix domain-containing protein [Ruania halotolerans]|uniref:helix-turn-helix domain-containing protein n=1 Tax=Ruania halotolerans TaxID=2897773 RepID=UPI001E584AA5|nr:helix-turn-helix domain-containing protein [Ruania halotolerans]UFU06992.1 helix-turn-helix domain-containing protein [Ruania halotolerans]